MGGKKLSDFGSIWIKTKCSFWFCHTENPDFCATGGGRNHLQKQGNFLIDDRNSIFFAWFHYIVYRLV